MITLGLAFMATSWAAAALALGILVVLAIVIDAAVQANQVVSQRIIFTAPAQVRGRVNALYMTINFAGGAIGSILGTVTYYRGGWGTTALVGGLAGALSLLLFAIERRGHRVAAARVP